MKRNGMTLACVCSALMAVCAMAPAITLDNPYLNPITNANLFSLKPPPNPEDSLPKPPPPNVPKVMLTGISTILGGKRAFMVVPRPARPPQPAENVPLALAERAPAQEGIQVLEINVAAGTVKIDNNGTIQTLDMEHDSPKTAAATGPAKGGVPVPAPNPRSAIPMPKPVTTPPPVAVPSLGRPMRGNASASQSTGVVGAGPSGIPTQTAQQTRSQLTPEQQIVLMEVERERTKDKVAAGLMPPLPPTPMTPGGSAGMSEESELPAAQ